jgi:hypothetical protein
MPARVEAELDIFSGMPNPRWTLTDAEADSFVKRLAVLSSTSGAELSGNLGYRGFIVHVMQGVNVQLVRVQAGVVHITKGATNVYVYDENRELERWLLTTGRTHLKNELLQIVEREFL